MVISHMTIPPGKEKVTFERFSQGLFYHHIFTIFAFTWSLCTHKLSGLCIFGLLFEVPVVLLSMRDIFASYEVEFRGFPWKSGLCRGCNGMGFKIYMASVMILFIIFRGVACFLWPLSLVIWRDVLATLPVGSQIVYHLLGVMFCFVNIVVFFSYVTRYIMEDMVRMNYMSLSSLFNKIDRTKPLKSSVSTPKHDLEAPIVSVDIPVKEVTKVVKFIIDSQIYDVTSFLDEHPGGREVLLHAGDASSDGIPDVTKAFNDVGHSKYAHNLMKKYMVSPSDAADKSSNLRESSKSFIVDNNHSSPYEIEKEDVFQLPYKIAVEYSTLASNQMFISILVYILAVYFLCGGYRGSSSSLYSIVHIQQHLSQSLQCAIFPLLLPSLFFLFTPGFKGLLMFQTHIAAILLVASITLDIALLQCDDIQVRKCIELLLRLYSKRCTGYWIAFSAGVPLVIVHFGVRRQEIVCIGQAIFAAGGQFKKFRYSKLPL